ncbi:MAG TPA: TlpA disulfide reductase family protein, partial [Polyangia bacterium]|nr:TlpA disulfide reductase family protein [Polyangia bacterium]
MTPALLVAMLAAADAGAGPRVEVAELPAIMAAIKAPGARAVLVNVWASWCEPCREEMPDLVRFYHEHRAEDLRLMLISADDDNMRPKIARILSAMNFDGPAFIKRDND